MSERSTGLMLQALATPMITASLALLSWVICSQSGWCVSLAVVWLVGFFVLGLEAHGLFYVFALPISHKYHKRSGLLRFVKAFWFLQVPFAMFNGVRPPISIAATQGLIALCALRFMFEFGRRNRIRRSQMMNAGPNAALDGGPATRSLAQTDMPRTTGQIDCRDPCRWLEQSWWSRCAALRWLRRLLLGYGIGYVRFDGDPRQLWREAMRHAPVAFRWFGRSLTVEDVDAELDSWPEWLAAKEMYRPGDRIWPFIINPDTWAMRLGYVIVRNRRPIGGVVRITS